MEVKYLYWSFDLEVRSYSMFGAVLRVYRKENDSEFDIYRISDEGVKAMELMNGERSWNEVVDKWMERRTDNRDAAEAELRKILKKLKGEYQIELYGKSKKNKRVVKVFRAENGKNAVYD